MKVLIAGAGELGSLLAEQLCTKHHDVVLIDESAEELAHASEKLDIMTVQGSCSSVSDLKRADVENANALLAVSGDEASNIIACQLASKMGVKNTICRLYSSDTFSEENDIGAQQFGIWRTFSPPEECTRKILGVISNKVILECIQFSHKDAIMTLLSITQSSPLAGVAIKSIPDKELLRSIRLAAVLRGSQVIVPHGDTILAPGDKIYVAGHKDHVDKFIQFLSDDDSLFRNRHSHGRVIIVPGTDETGRLTAEQANRQGFDVRCIVRDEEQGTKLLDDMPQDLPNEFMVIHGDPTDENVLEEAGISACDDFISIDPDDESNILSCILAKRMGASKTISLTRKPEYIRIVPSIDMIDCGLSSTLVSINVVLRLLESGMMRVDALLQSFSSCLTEFKVSERSPLCGKPLSKCDLPKSTILALVFRGSEVITPSGATKLQSGDIAVAIATRQSIRELEPFFPK